MSENKINLVKVTIGNFFTNDSSNIPQIEINFEDMNGNTNQLYLSAFRWYRFQISGDRNGDGDYGSTHVFGMDTFGSIVSEGPCNLCNENIVKYIISCVAMDAINEHIHNGLFKRRFKTDEDTEVFYQIPKNCLDGDVFGYTQGWIDFINAVYALLQKRMDEKEEVA